MRAAVAGATTVVGLLVAAPHASALQETIGRGALNLDEPHVDSLAVGEVHSWSVDVTEGQYLFAEVTTTSVDVIVYLLDPSGEVRLPVDGAYAEGTEPVRFIADLGGRWSLSVTALDPSASGAYEILLSALREPTEIEVAEVEANSLMMKSVGLMQSGEYRPARDAMSEAIERLGVVYGPESGEVALRVADLGWFSVRLGEYDRAADYYGEALSILEREVGPESMEVAGVLNNLGGVRDDQGLHGEGEAYYRRALAIMESRPVLDRGRIAETQNNLGLAVMIQGRWREAEVILEDAATLTADVFGPESESMATMLSTLTELRFRQGRLRDAERLASEALRIAEAILGPDHPDLAGHLNNLASTYDAQGRLAEAGILQRRALGILEATLDPGHPRIAVFQNNLAGYYQQEGRFEEADSLFLSAIASLEERTQGDRRDASLDILAEQKGNLGFLYLAAGRHSEAEPLLRDAMETLRELGGGFTPPLTTLARLLDATDRTDEAWPIHEEVITVRSRDLGEAHPETGRALTTIANAARTGGHVPLDSALSLADRSIAILDRTPGYPQWRAEAYEARAKILEAMGREDDAIDDLDVAIDEIEAMRSLVGGAEETRARFFEGFAGVYDRMVRLQVGAADIDAALDYAERGRARVLLSQLELARVDLKASVPVELRSALTEREDDANARVAEFQQRSTLLRARDDLDDEVRLAGVLLLQDSLTAARGAYREVRSEILAASGVWSRLYGRGTTVDLRTLQREAVPDDGLMLVYQIDDEGGMVFVIPPVGADATAVQLSVSDGDARALGVEAGPLSMSALASIVGAAGDEAGLLPTLGSTATRGTEVLGRRRGASVTDRLHALWRVLFPSELWERVQAVDRTIIVPDGPLHAVPFDALVVEAGGSPESTRYWLDVGPVVQYSPSASVLFSLTGQPDARALAGGDGILSLSDPVYDPTEVAEILAVEEPASDEPDAPLTRNAFERAGGSLARLPGTAVETEAIREAIGPSGADRFVALQRLEATEPALRDAIDGTTFLHLATHGLVDEQSGSLFAALALTPPATETTDPSDDGFLQLYEIYDLPLAGVELVVLSACESHVGTTVESEGVFALSRGFLARGARRVVATQWAVDDASTAALVGDFFGAVVADGLVDYATALRDAKRAVRAQAAWADPYHWAPFVMTGGG